MPTLSYSPPLQEQKDEREEQTSEPLNPEIEKLRNYREQVRDTSLL
jgi:hypothetical protein